MSVQIALAAEVERLRAHCDWLLREVERLYLEAR